MPFKIIHFFRDESTGLGWSEVWYTQAATFDQASTAGKAWANYRLNVLAPDNLIEYQRITGNLPTNDDPRARQLRQSILEKISQSGRAAVAPEDSDLPWTAVKVRWTSNDRSVFRTQLIRGVPDSWFDRGEDKVAQSKMKLWIADALPLMALQQLAVRHLGAPTPPSETRPFAYFLPTLGQYEGYTRRATGRPFGLPRGRRPNRKVVPTP